MRVPIFVLRDGKQVQAGALTLKDGALQVAGPEPDVLHAILEEPVRDLETGAAIDPQEDPEGFLRNLLYTYRGAYLRAGAPENDDAADD